MEESSVNVDVAATTAVIVTMAVAMASVVMVVAFVVSIVVVMTMAVSMVSVVVVVMMMIVAVVVVMVVMMVMLSFLVNEVLLQRCIVDLLLGLLLRMSMAAAFTSFAVVMLTAKMIVTLARVQNFHLDQVKYETHDGDDQHQISLDLRRLEEPLGGLAKKPDRHDPDGRNGDERTNNLSSVPAVGQVRG